MTRTFRWPALGPLLVAALLGAACGGGAKETKPPAAQEPSPLAAAVASATPVRDAGLPEEEPPAPPATDAGSTGIPECDRYLAAIDRMVACEALPEEQRESMREMGREQRQLLEVLGDPKIREERRRSAADACRRGADSLDQAFANGVCGATPAPMP